MNGAGKGKSCIGEGGLLLPLFGEMKCEGQDLYVGLVGGFITGFLKELFFRETGDNAKQEPILNYAAW